VWFAWRGEGGGRGTERSAWEGVGATKLGNTTSPQRKLEKAEDGKERTLPESEKEREALVAACGCKIINGKWWKRLGNSLAGTPEGGGKQYQQRKGQTIFTSGKEGAYKGTSGGGKTLRRKGGGGSKCKKKKKRERGPGAPCSHDYRGWESGGELKTWKPRSTHRHKIHPGTTRRAEEGKDVRGS